MDSPFFNTGLPQLPTNVDPKIELDMRDVYNAIRNLANAIGQYGGYEASYEGFRLASQVLYTAGAYKRRVYCEALEAITYGGTVNLVNTAGTLTVQYANATTGLKPCQGICNTIGTCAIGDIIEVVLPGCYVTSIGGLTPGTFYYQSTSDGAITNVAPTNIQSVGFALAENVLYFWLDSGAVSGGGGTGDVVGPAASGNNNVAFFDGVTGKVIKDSGLGLSGNNTGDQTSIVGITGTRAEFDAALTGDNFLYVGDVTQYTDEMAQDAVGGMVDATLIYNDGAATLRRAAITGMVDIPAGSNVAGWGSFSSASLRGAVNDETGTGVLVFADNPSLTIPLMTTPRITAGTIFYNQAAPVVKAAAATLTIAELLTGIIQYTGAAANLTLPTGALTDPGVTALVLGGGLAVNMAFDFVIMNTGGATVTLAAGVGFTILGTATVLTGISACFRCRRTAANTWVAMRI